MAETPDDTALVLPRLALPRDGGAEVDLGALAGTPVVLFFYPKDNTKGCTAEAIDFSRFLLEFQALGVEVFGVSRDSVESHERFIARHGLAVPLLSDTDGALCEALGVWREKSMYGRKFMGIERSTFLFGPDGRLIRAWRKVRVPGHAEEVLEAARQALA